MKSERHPHHPGWKRIRVIVINPFVHFLVFHLIKHPTWLEIGDPQVHFDGKLFNLIETVADEEREGCNLNTLLIIR